MTLLDSKYFEDAMGDPGVDAIFVGESRVDDVCKQRQEIKADYGRADVLVTEVTTLLVALDRSSAATAIRLLWNLVRARYGFAQLKQLETAQLQGVFKELTPQVQAAFQTAALDLARVESSMQSQGAMKNAAEALSTDLYGLPKLNEQVLQRDTAAESMLKELLQNIMAKSATCLQSVAEALEQKVPAYTEYVVTTFDVEKIQAELLAHESRWETFAHEWVGHSKFHTACLSLAATSLGKFAVLHKAQVVLSDRALKAGRTFIAVVSTVKLILVILPATKKGERGSMISAQIEKSKSSGLPSNLIEYLTRELKKHSAGTR